jgi:hypothetical protein
MSKQVDAYSLYEAGARELLNRIGEDHPLYPNADAHARNNRLQTGVKLAERARRILKMWGDRHNTMVAQLLIARLQVSCNSNDARRKYLEALDLCRKLKSGKRETARDEEALLYEQIIEGIQQALNGVSKVVKEPYEHRYSLNSIPILRLSDGPDAIVGRSGVIDHVANGEFRIGGRTYFLHPLNETAGHTLELRDSAVHFALPVPEDGWLDPASKEGDYALARWDPQVTQEGPGVMWTENEWVAGRFERDTEGDFRFCPQPPRIIGSQKIELCKVVALLRRTTRRSLGGSGV